MVTLAGRDLLLISRIAGVSARIAGFLSAGTSVQERLVRLVRLEGLGERVLLRAIPRTNADAATGPSVAHTGAT